MRTRKIRYLSLLLALVMVLGLFAGCSKNETKTTDTKKEETTKSTTKDSIVIATANETPSLSPTQHNAVAGSYMNLLTYNTLFKGAMDLKPVPDLVEDYKNVTDSEWEMTLKKGVKFHNGEEMKADDVVASLQWAKTFPEVSLYNESIAKVEKIDDYKIKITTDGPDARLLSDLSHHGNSIVPKSLIDSGNDFNKNPIGTGPYVFKEWVSGDKIVFEAFKDYFEGEPPIKNMTWRIIPEGSSRTIALEAGEIDFIVEVEAMDAERLRGNDKLSVLEYHATNETWMMLNNEKPGLDNVLVRKAINAAVDKDSVVQVAYNGMAVPAYSQAPNNLPGGSEDKTDKYDVEKAKKYLADSKVDPASIKFSIICSDDTKKRAGEVVQANLKENLGINCEIESMDLATYLSTTAEGNYTAAIGGYSSSTMLGYMIGVCHSKSINASNKTRMSNKDVDALIDKASKTVDEDARYKILSEAVAKVNDLCPQIPLYQPISLRAYNKNLKGVEVSDSGTLYFNKVSWAS
ncbi:ABC transporter substrate-binding protein [Acidaminobacterium chupaoyuni]